MMKKILIYFFNFFLFLLANAYAQEFKLEKVIVDGLNKPWSLSFIDDIKYNFNYGKKRKPFNSLNLE